MRKCWEWKQIHGDKSLSITNLTRSCRCLLYNIRRIRRPVLSREVTQLLVQSFLLLKLYPWQVFPTDHLTPENDPDLFAKFSRPTPLLHSLISLWHAHSAPVFLQSSSTTQLDLWSFRIEGKHAWRLFPVLHSGVEWTSLAVQTAESLVVFYLVFSRSNSTNGKVLKCITVTVQVLSSEVLAELSPL